MLAKDATKTLPIVALGVDDPVEMGLVASIARPGGNITGISAAFSGLLAKRLQLLKDIVPAARRFAVVFNPISVSPKTLADSVPGWEAGLGVAVSLVEVRGPDDFAPAFAAMVKERVNGVVFVADAMIWIHRAKLGDLCLKRGLPSVWGGGSYLDAGVLRRTRATGRRCSVAPPPLSTRSSRAVLRRNAVRQADMIERRWA